MGGLGGGGGGGGEQRLTERYCFSVSFLSQPEPCYATGNAAAVLGFTPAIFIKHDKLHP